MTDPKTYDEFLKRIACEIGACPEKKDAIIEEAMRCSGCPYLQRMIRRSNLIQE